MWTPLKSGLNRNRFEMEVVTIIDDRNEFRANGLEEEDASTSCDREVECTGGDLVDEGDQLAEKMEVVTSDTGKGRHVLDLINTAKEGKEQMVTMMHQAVLEQLRSLGVNFEPPATRGRVKARKSNSVKPGRADYGYNKLMDVQVRSVNVTLKVPFLIQEVCQYLRKYIDVEGIFRKSGSNSRVQNLMQRFASLDNNQPFSFTQYDTVFDVATVLKQYLREMEAPLIPYDLHGLFRLCLELPSKESREEAVLLCISLIPEFNIYILAYLIEFLNEVVQHSIQNKMSLENLAIVFGPNIMPLENRKSDKAKDLEQERKLLDAHTKIMEILIGNGHKTAYLPRHVEQKIEADFSHRGSEDELENEGVARRKKRRSGSLTRVLGFLKKVASSKSGDASVPQTPVDFPPSAFTHTPVIKSGSKRRCLDENIFSLQKKKTILDGIRKNGLVVKDEDIRFSHITDTPNSIAGFITCPSPVCLNPSPLKMDWKHTPNASRLKNLVTPSLLRRKEKRVDLTKPVAPFSAPAKPTKSKLGLGKKSAKKQPPSTVLTENNGTRREVKRLPSSVSIHKMAGSPRKVVRASSTRIPRPDKLNTVRKSNSSCRFPTASGNDLVGISGKRVNISSISGEYVTLSPSAQVRDIKNEAFIASKLSCLEDTVSDFAADAGKATPEIDNLRLTPLIQEINTLTLTAQQELTLSGLRHKRSIKASVSQPHSEKPPPPVPSRSTRRRSSGASTNKARLRSPPDNSIFKSEGQENKNPVSQGIDENRSKLIRQVEEKFVRAMKETKIMRIQSERTAQVHTRAVHIHRRFSVQDKGVSPSQRRIISNAARRRSHELNRVVATPVNDLSRYGCQTDSMIRSPNRCTLKRGRPNTLRSGLARPSPVVSSRNTSGVKQSDENSRENANSSRKVNPQSPKKRTPTTPTPSRNNQTQTKKRAPDDVSTPLRRISSIQELVKLMDKGPKNKSGSNIPISDTNAPLKPMTKTEPPPAAKRTLPKRASSSKFLKPAVPSPSPGLTPKTPRRSISSCNSSKQTRSVGRQQPGDAWVPAANFNFETQKSRFFNGIRNEDRDSIQALKSLNAGKVSENVKLFNGMSRTRKSPGKSLIPRYVALHQQESFKK